MRQREQHLGRGPTLAARAERTIREQGIWQEMEKRTEKHHAAS
jgi:hypothetical protein